MVGAFCIKTASNVARFDQNTYSSGPCRQIGTFIDLYIEVLIGRI